MLDGLFNASTPVEVVVPVNVNEAYISYQGKRR